MNPNSKKNMPLLEMTKKERILEEDPTNKFNFYLN